MKKGLFVFLLLSLFSLYSQEDVVPPLSKKEVLKIIDKELNSRSESLSSTLLTLDIDLTEYEEYLLDRTDDILSSGDLDFSLVVVETVLFINLENSRAQEMYKIIIDKKIEIEDRRLLEKNKGKIKRDTIKEKDKIITPETSEHDRVMSSIIKKSLDLESSKKNYVDQEFAALEYVTNTFFYPFSKSFYKSEVNDDFLGRADTFHDVDGAGFDVGIAYALKGILIRWDIGLSFLYSDLFKDSEKYGTFLSTFSLGYNLGVVPVYIRMGFFYNQYYLPASEPVKVALTSLPSPTIGIGLIGLNLFSVVTLDFSIDGLIAANYTNSFDLGFFAKSYMSINLFRIDTIQFEIRGGADFLYYSESGLSEINITPRVGLGVSSYE